MWRRFYWPCVSWPRVFSCFFNNCNAFTLTHPHPFVQFSFQRRESVRKMAKIWTTHDSLRTTRGEDATQVWTGCLYRYLFLGTFLIDFINKILHEEKSIRSLGCVMKFSMLIKEILSIFKNKYIYIYIYIHTHTYIYASQWRYVCVCVYVSCLGRSWKYKGTAGNKHSWTDRYYT